MSNLSESYTFQNISECVDIRLVILIKSLKEKNYKIPKLSSESKKY